MKASLVVLALASFAGGLGCATSGGTIPRAPDGVRYEGGDGLSCETRVIILGADFQTGVQAEYAWLGAKYPGFERRSQSLTDCQGKQSDAVQITTADGKQLTVYFDVTDFFGKGMGL